MMDCKELRKVLDLYIDRELSEEALAEAESHIGECVACRSVVEQLKHLRQAVRTTVAQYDVPAALLSRIRTQSPARLSRRHSVLIAACALIALLGGAVVSPMIRGSVANELEEIAMHLDHPRTVVLEGKLLCRDDELHARYGAHAMCSTKGHHGTLETPDGRFWNLIETETSQELIHNSALLGKTVRIRGKLYRQAGALEVQNYQVL